MRDHILPYVDDSDKEIRQAAALACCRALERYASVLAEARRKEGLGPLSGLGVSMRQTKVVEKVVGKLLMAAVADTSERVRKTVLKVGRVGSQAWYLVLWRLACS